MRAPLCSTCGEKDGGKFSPKSLYRCRACHVQVMKDYRAEHKARMQTAMRRYHQKKKVERWLAEEMFPS